jgi:hypothetical protein
VSARVVRWSKVASQMLSRRGSISPSRAAKMLANRTAPDVFSSDALTNLHLHLEKVDPEGIAEIRDL